MFLPLQMKEKKSRAASSSVAQKKGNSKQSYGFVDNRPNITQCKIIRKKNKSNLLTDVVIERALCCDGYHDSGGVAQFKLMKDKLNVAGEEHKETEIRDALERRFCEKMTGSKNYWQEHEFTRLNGTAGDPHELKYRKFILSLARSVKAIQSFNDSLINDLNDLKLEAKKESPVVPRINTVEAYSKYVKEIVLDWVINSLKKLKSINEQTEQDSIYIEKIEREMGFLNDVYKNLLNEGEGKYIDKKPFDYLSYIAVDTMEIVNAIKKINNINFDRDKSDIKLEEQNVDKARSEKMHESAQEMQKLRGVWKIGEEHVTDIVKIPNVTMAYNLISLREFNREYKEFVNNCSEKKGENQCTIF